MYFVACLWFKTEKAQKCASDLLTKAQSEKRKAKAQFIKPPALSSTPDLSLTLWEVGAQGKAKEKNGSGRGKGWYWVS